MTEEQFKEERRKGIGGSDLAVILGISPFKNITQLWHEKVDGDYPYFAPAQKKRMAEGKALEPEIIQWCAEFNLFFKLKVSVGLELKKHEKDYIKGNIDAIGYDDRDNPFGIEAKTALYKNMKKDWAEGIPLYYQAQCYWYGIGIGIDKWVVPVFFMEDGEVIEKKVYHFNIKDFPYSKELVFEKCDAFWESVQEGIAPMSDKDQVKVEGMARLMIEEYREWSEKEKVAKARKTEIADLFKKDVKDGRGIELLDNHYQKIATLYPTTRKSFDKAAFFLAHPELVETYKKFEIKSQSIGFKLIEVKEDE